MIEATTSALLDHFTPAIAGAISRLIGQRDSPLEVSAYATEWMMSNNQGKYTEDSPDVIMRAICEAMEPAGSFIVDEFPVANGIRILFVEMRDDQTNTDSPTIAWVGRPRTDGAYLIASYRDLFNSYSALLAGSQFVLQRTGKAL